jgi:DNA-binding PadR family transcriptional regulator|tara:strand:- start:18404 stop:18829 length:426 start_codon:yes stop_codon:yes gene_type:complete
MKRENKFVPGVQFLVMLAMYRRKRPMAAVEIGRDIEAATGEKIIRPNLHRILSDLDVKAWAGRVPVEDGGDGRRRHSYELTPEGAAQVEWMAEGILMLGAMEAGEAGRRRRVKGQDGSEREGRAVGKRPPMQDLAAGIAAQ